MRILIASVVDPEEQRGGGWAVTAGLIKAMKIAWPGSQIDCIADRSRGPALHRFRQVTSIVLSLVAGNLPAKMRFTRTRSIRRRISEYLERNVPDMIVLNGSDMLWLRSDLPQGVPVVLIVLNLEHVLYERQIANAQAGALGLGTIMKQDCERLRELELDGLRAASVSVFLSEDELASASGAIGPLHAVFIPPSFDYEVARRRVVDDRVALGMFADFTWWPNRLALDWFAKQVWPSVAHRYHLHLIGHGSLKAAPGVSGLTRHGFVTEPRDAFALCDVMIAPITDGAGIKVKVAEALYNGVPVLATPAAVSRIFTDSNPALKVCAGAEEWIAFLDSDEGGRLARERVPAAIREKLSVISAANVLRTILPANPGGKND